MPQVRKKKKVDGSARPEERAISPIRKGWAGNKRPYLIVAAVIAVVLVIVGFAYYQQYVVPFQRVVITVDNQQVRMGYFLERARISGSGGIAELQTLTNEILVKDGAPRYGITVTSKDVDAYLRQQAAGSDNTTVTDAEFREWYRQLLDTNRVSDKTYREIITNQLLATKLEDHLGQSIPSTLPTADVYGIFVSTYDEATQVKQRIEAGEDFSKVAQAVSIDQTSADNGGELGWVPKGVDVLNMDPFSLKVGEVSDPIADTNASDPTQAPNDYYVLMVKQVENRPVDPQYLPQLQNNAMQDWLNTETKAHTVKWNYNSQIDAWVNWQLSKNSPATTTASSGSSGSGQ